jgi:hypothetical protein
LLSPGGACPAGFVIGVDVVGVAGADASLGASDEAEDGGARPVEFAGGCAGTCALAMARGTATRLEGDGGERPVWPVVLGGNVSVESPGGFCSVASLGEGGGVVVAGGCCSSVTGRLPLLTPDEMVNRPANTRTVNVAAATTAAPMTPAPTTKALRIAVRVSSRRDARRSALVLRRPAAYPDES